jgi:hypothetical protein
MRKTLTAVVVLTLTLLFFTYLLKLHYPNATLINETNWTIFGKDSEWFWALMQFVVVTITLALIYGELRISSAAHMLSSLTCLNERWTSKDMVWQRRKLCEAYLKNESVLVLGHQIVFTFFEEVGLYVSKRWVPRKVIWDTYSYYIENYWDMCSQEVAARQSKDSSTFEQFAWLAKTMRTLNRKRRIPSTTRTKEQLREFAEGEINGSSRQCIESEAAKESTSSKMN